MEHSHNSQGNSLLFPLTFDLSFIQQVKKVRPRTAMNMVERRTWSKYSLLLSHTPSYSFMNTPSSLAYIPTSHTETLRLLFCLQLASFPQKKKKKVQTDAFGMRNFPDHLFHNPNCFPHCDHPGSSEFKLLPLTTPCTIFKVFLNCSHKHSQVTSKKLLLLQLTKQCTTDDL